MLPTVVAADTIGVMSAALLASGFLRMKRNTPWFCGPGVLMSSGSVKIT